MTLMIYNIFNYIYISIYWLLIILVTIRILIKRRTVPSFMAWLLIIYVLPVIGIIIYLLLGELNLGIKRSIKGKIAWSSSIKRIKTLKAYKQIFSYKNSEVADSLFKLCEHRQGIGAVPGNQIQLFKRNDDILISLIKDMDLAQYSIDMVFYIWEPGGLVDNISNKLIMASQRGVRCRLILDSIGCINFFHSAYPNIFRQAGISIVKALHINLLRIFFRRMDLRQHRKMILIDDHIAYTGSMNMVDPTLFKKNSGIGQWIDIMIRIDGPVTLAMGIIFAFDWEMETGERTIALPLNNQHVTTTIQHSSFKEDHTNHTIQIIPSGPDFPEGIIHQVLITSLYKAHKQLIITTPYFIPSDDLLNAICTAAQRGVKVHIIIPHNNDSLLVNWASRAFFSELLDSGVLIYRFQKGLLHVKSILIDQQLSLIGTVNLDIRSIWLNLEITLLIDSKNFSNNLEAIQQDYIAHSILIDPKAWSNRPYWERIVERLFYFLSPLL